MAKSIEERDLSPEEMLSMINSMSGFSTSRYSYGVLKDVDEKELQKWMANPSRYIRKICHVSIYYTRRYIHFI